MQDDLGAPACENGHGPVQYGSDAMTGVTTVWCPVCGERPLKRRGAVQYEQRADLEEELAESVERAGRLVKNPKRPEHCGDAFRQRAHKKGWAA